MKPEVTPPAADSADLAETVTPETVSDLTNAKNHTLTTPNSTRDSVGKAAGKARTRRDGYDAEDTFQIAAAALLDSILPKPESWWCHIPNGGKRNSWTGARLKKMGTKAGAPDCLIVWQGKAHWIELKARYGSLQDSQLAAFPKIMAAGSPVAVARTLEDIVDTLTAWGIPMTTTLEAFRIRHGLAVAAAKVKSPVKPVGLSETSGTIRLSSAEYRAVAGLDGDTNTTTAPASWPTTKPAVAPRRRFWRRRKKVG